MDTEHIKVVIQRVPREVIASHCSLDCVAQGDEEELPRGFFNHTRVITSTCNRTKTKQETTLARINFIVDSHHSRQFCE